MDLFEVALGPPDIVGVAWGCRNPTNELDTNVCFRPIADIRSGRQAYVMNEELSEAVQLYLGYGSASWPREDASKVTARFGAEADARLLARVQSIMHDASNLRPDWEAHSLSSAKDWAESEIKQRHPELSSDALAALGWAFSYWWK